MAARQGDREEASRISRLLDEGVPSLNLFPSESAYERAQIAAALGERERAMRLLRESGDLLTFPNLLHTDPNLEPLWDYPAFQELLRPKG